MPAYTIVTTSAAQGSNEAEINTLADYFGDESEAVGYARRLADEMLGLAAQLSLDFDYSNVSLYEGDLIDEELNPQDPSFVGMWILDEVGVAFVGAAEVRENPGDDPAPQ